jgi:hypothetical protein
MKYFALLSLIVLFSCTNAKQKEFEQFSRLKGSWEMKKGSTEFIETWKQVNDTLLEGTSKMTMDGKTLFSEDLQLVLTNDSIYYIPTVSYQNDQEEVRFALKSASKDKWVFANKTHDFPQEIIYVFKDNDSLIATVQGMENGRSQKIDFRLKRK